MRRSPRTTRCPNRDRSLSPIPQPSLPRKGPLFRAILGGDNISRRQIREDGEQQGRPELTAYQMVAQGSSAGGRGAAPGIYCQIQTSPEFGNLCVRAAPGGLAAAALRPAVSTCAQGWSRPLPSAPAWPECASVGPQCDPAGLRGNCARRSPRQPVGQGPGELPPPAITVSRKEDVEE